MIDLAKNPEQTVGKLFVLSWDLRLFREDGETLLPTGSYFFIIGYRKEKHLHEFLVCVKNALGILKFRELEYFSFNEVM